MWPPEIPPHFGDLLALLSTFRYWPVWRPSNPSRLWGWTWRRGDCTAGYESIYPWGFPTFYPCRYRRLKWPLINISTIFNILITNMMTSRVASRVEYEANSDHYPIKSLRKAHVETGIGGEASRHIAPQNYLRYIKLLCFALKKQRILRGELDSLVRFLSFAAKVVIPGRAFLRRLLICQSQVMKRLHTPQWEYHSGPHMMATFLSKWNGIRMLKPPRRTFRIWTDAFDGYDMRTYILIEDQNFFIMPTSHALFKRRQKTRPVQSNPFEI